MHRVLRLLSASGAREPGGHLFLPPWGALVETEFRDSNTLTQHTQRGGLGPQSAPRGPASQAPPTSPRVRWAAATSQPPETVLSPFIGHLSRAKSQLGMSLVGDLSNESCKAYRGWGRGGCRGVRVAHHQHKKHLLITRTIKRAGAQGLIAGPASPHNHGL